MQVIKFKKNIHSQKFKTSTVELKIEDPISNLLVKRDLHIFNEYNDSLDF